jgi:anti-sigma regulatory factor (Ser/Thr protein kinase)
MFHARLSELRSVNAFVASFCEEMAMPREACLRLNLVLEELFVNTVRHGHRADSAAPVWMALDSAEGSVRVTYEDTAPPFNPYAKLPSTPPDTTVEMRKIGGLGVLLTKELAATRDYSYVFGRNRVRLLLLR